jgi:hypothetical protein
MDAPIKGEASSVVYWRNRAPERHAARKLIYVQRERFLLGDGPDARASAHIQFPAILACRVRFVSEAPVTHATVSSPTNRGHMAGAIGRRRYWQQDKLPGGGSIHFTYSYLPRS